MGRKAEFKKATANIKDIMSGKFDYKTLPIEDGGVNNIQNVKKDPRGRKRNKVIPNEGEFYSGIYDAITPLKIIKVYDSLPIFYVLDKGVGKNGAYVLVVNFNWIPQKHRKKAINAMLSNGGGKSRLKTGKKLSFDYGKIKKKKVPNKYFYKIIRKYYIDRLTNVIKIPNKVIYDNILYNEKEIVGSKKSATQMLAIYNAYQKG
jgi:hypothetical protein